MIGRAFLVVVLTPSLGCASLLTMQHARVLEEGQVEMAFAPVALQGTPESLAAPPVVLNLAAGVRRGMGHGWELGARAWWVGAALEGKYQLLAGERLRLSLGASAAITADFEDASSPVFDLALPLLAGVPLGPVTAVVGLKAQGRVWRVSVSNARDPWTFDPMPGAVLALDIPLGGGFSIMPEVDVYRWTTGRTWVFQAAIGVYFVPS